MSKDFEQQLKKMTAENHENAVQLSYGSSTSTWSSKLNLLILGDFVVLQNHQVWLCFQLHLEVSGPEHRYFKSSQKIKETTDTHPLDSNNIIIKLILANFGMADSVVFRL